MPQQRQTCDRQDATRQTRRRRQQRGNTHRATHRPACGTQPRLRRACDSRAALQQAGQATSQIATCYMRHETMHPATHKTDTAHQTTCDYAACTNRHHAACTTESVATDNIHHAKDSIATCNYKRAIDSMQQQCKPATSTADCCNESRSMQQQRETRKGRHATWSLATRNMQPRLLQPWLCAALQHAVATLDLSSIATRNNAACSIATRSQAAAGHAERPAAMRAASHGPHRCIAQRAHRLRAAHDRAARGMAADRAQRASARRRARRAGGADGFSSGAAGRVPHGVPP